MRRRSAASSEPLCYGGACSRFNVSKPTPESIPRMPRTYGASAPSRAAETADPRRMLRARLLELRLGVHRDAQRRYEAALQTLEWCADETFRPLILFGRSRHDCGCGARPHQESFPRSGKATVSVGTKPRRTRLNMRNGCTVPSTL